MITIKDFSDKTGFSVRMLRYLEEFDLLKPSRGDNNYRYYQTNQIEIARKMRQMQNLGFQLNEIKTLLDSDWKKQVVLIESVHKREKEIVEAQSVIIPRLLDLIQAMKKNEFDIFSALNTESKEHKPVVSLGDDQKFQRTAYFIPELKLVYDDIEKKANINFTEIDFWKFKSWLEEIESAPTIYSFLKDSTFAFGINLTPTFVTAFKESWNSHLHEGQMNEVSGFELEDVSQLMGMHDVIIRAKFIDDKGAEGAIVIPYAHVFAMTKK